MASASSWAAGLNAFTDNVAPAVMKRIEQGKADERKKKRQDMLTQFYRTAQAGGQVTPELMGQLAAEGFSVPKEYYTPQEEIDLTAFDDDIAEALSGGAIDLDDAQLVMRDRMDEAYKGKLEAETKLRHIQGLNEVQARIGNTPVNQLGEDDFIDLFNGWMAVDPKYATDLSKQYHKGQSSEKEAEKERYATLLDAHIKQHGDFADITDPRIRARNVFLSTMALGASGAEAMRKAGEAVGGGGEASLSPKDQFAYDYLHQILPKEYADQKFYDYLSNDNEDAKAFTKYTSLLSKYSSGDIFSGGKQATPEVIAQAARESGWSPEYGGTKSEVIMGLAKKMEANEITPDNFAALVEELNKYFASESFYQVTLAYAKKKALDREPTDAND